MSYFEILGVCAVLGVLLVVGNILAKRRFRKRSGAQPPDEMYPLW